jgi:hypothetical protein
MILCRTLRFKSDPLKTTNKKATVKVALFIWRPQGDWLRGIHATCPRFARVASRTKSAILPIDSGRPALRPLGQHSETMLFKIIPDDFVSNLGIRIIFK